jgi:hypothetical protein
MFIAREIQMRFKPQRGGKFSKVNPISTLGSPANDATPSPPYPHIFVFSTLQTISNLF